MFDSLRKLVSELAEGGKHPSRFGDSDYRLAATALLVHAASIDGDFASARKRRASSVRRCSSDTVCLKRRRLCILPLRSVGIYGAF